MRRAAACALVLATLVLGGCAAGERHAGTAASGRDYAAAGTVHEAPADVVTLSPRTKRRDPCATHRARAVLVSIRNQYARMCERHHTVYRTHVTTGMSGPYTQTPTGRFRIQGRSRDAVLTLNTGAQYHVRYWIPFQAPLFGFHDASWQQFPFGSARYKTAGSHGCIHMPVRAMRFLYKWGETGTRVIIHA